MNHPQPYDAPFGALSVSSFCNRYGIKRSKFYLEKAAGRIAVRKAGKSTLIPVAEAERWLASLPEYGLATPLPADQVPIENRPPLVA